MIIKKFVGKNEIEATEAAKKELGEDLVIMNVKYVKAKGAFSFLKAKQVEVTAALEDDDEPLRQIRRIAQAQVEAQEKVKAAGGITTVMPGSEKKSASSHEKKTEGATAVVAAAAARTGIGPAGNGTQSNVGGSVNLVADETTLPGTNGQGSVNSSSIEQKLDSLQSLLESQIRKENRVLEDTVSSARKTEDVLKEDVDSGSKQLSEKETEVDQMDKEVERFLKLLYNTMIDAEVDEHYANEIIADAESARKPGLSMDFLLSTIYQKMILKFGKSSGVDVAEKGPKIVFFIGPTGVGKTTTIAKVASSYSVNEKKRVALVTTDTYRIAATDQLRTYAGILEVPFRVVYDPKELLLAVQDFKDCDFIFVDTAGHSHKNAELLEKQKEFIEAVSDYEVQNFLVMSATTKYKDLLYIADKYGEISDYQLIFTKLDETSGIGNLYNMRMYSGAPIAYVTYGQNVPDDIEVFNAQKIVKQLLSGKQ